MSARETITFTREQFYNKVWSAPATQIAKELGCSDVLIGKICKAYGIPKPYLGYWAKLEYGKKPQKTLLPKNDDPDLQSITFHKYPAHETTVSEVEPEPEYDPEIQQLLEKALALEPLRAAPSLTYPHPLVAATCKWLAAQRRPYYERSREERELRPALAVDVEQGSTTRACCIMDALIKRVEKIGGAVEIKKDRLQQWKRKTVVSFEGEEVSEIRLRERRKQVRTPADKKKHSWDRSIELQPTGMLVIDKGPGYFETIMLSDTPQRHRLEDGLHDLIIGFVRMAGQLRIERREAEIARKKREEAERIERARQEELRKRREELAKRQKEEQDRVDELIHHARAWQQSQSIRSYLGALCDMLLECREAPENQPGRGASNPASHD